MRRREFITLVGGAAAAWPAVARAQQSMPAVGVLYGASAAEWTDQIEGIRAGLAGAGFVEGRNVVLEYRWGDGDYGRLPALAVDLVRRKVAVLIAGGSAPATKSAMAATKTIPIIFTTASDPVAAGYVASLNRPGNNVTGATLLGGELGPKRVELIRELIPNATKLALLGNPSNPVTWQVTSRDEQNAARRLGLEPILLAASTEQELAQAFEVALQRGADALLVTSDTLFSSKREHVAKLAAHYRIPAGYSGRQHVEVGGLMSYGANRTEMYLQAGAYAGRILKGEKPGDLPVMQPTKFELVINLKTAKALGLNIPESFLLRADEVIE